MMPWEKYGGQEGPWAKYAKPDLKTQDPSEFDPSSPEWQAKYGPLSSDPNENFDAGAGKAMTDIVRGAGQYLGLVNREDVKDSRKLDAPLMDTTAGQAGNIAGGIATAAPAMAIPGVNTVAGSALVGGAYGALQPSESTGETLANMGLGGALGAAGQKAGTAVANWAGKKLATWTAKKAAEKAANVVRDTTLAEARQAGYVVPPATTNPGVVTRALESVSGKAATQQAAGIKNQKVTNNIIRKELNLAKDSPITIDVLEGIRTKAGQAYEAVKNAGQMIADQTYRNQVKLLSAEADKIAASFPKAKLGAAGEIKELQEAMSEHTFDAGAAVEFVKQLRKEASDNLSFGVSEPAKKALGRAQNRAAGFLEELIERNLVATGEGALMTAFRDARMQIAKSYTVQRALNQGTGNIIASKLASELRKAVPLSGGMKTAAKFAAAFPKAAAEQTDSTGVSALSAALAGGGAATLNPALLAAPAARVGIRELLLTGAGQRLGTPSYNQSATGTTLLRLLQAQPKLTQAASIGVPADVRQ